MPELPEVETVMRGLRARLDGRVITHAAIHRPDLRWMLPPSLAGTLTHARVLSFRRRAKYILMRLSGGMSVLIHLGMSGRMVIDKAADGPTALPPGRHEHMVLHTDDGWRIGFVDPRRFGSIDVVASAEEDTHRLLRTLGPEPLDRGFTAQCLAAALQGRRSSIKAALLDQRNIAGLGNIYVCEALFRARIAPHRAAGGLALREVASLVRAIRATLSDAIEAGGSSLRDYVQPDGELGYFQHQWKVYARQGQPCERCRTPQACPLIERITQSARSTFWCPRTQI